MRCISSRPWDLARAEAARSTHTQYESPHLPGRARASPNCTWGAPHALHDARAAGLGWGVRGAAAAGVAAQYAGAAVVTALLARSGVLKLSDLAQLPSWADAKPFFQACHSSVYF